MNLMKQLKRGGAAALLYFAATSGALAQQAAANWDTAGVVQEITSTRTTIIAVGVAVLGVVALILGYRMIRKITG